MLFGVVGRVDLDYILTYDHFVYRYLVLLQVFLVIALKDVRQVLLVHLLSLLALQLLVEQDLVALQARQLETGREGELQLQRWPLLQSRARLASQVQAQVQRRRALLQEAWLGADLWKDMIRRSKQQILTYHWLRTLRGAVLWLRDQAEQVPALGLLLCGFLGLLDGDHGPACLLHGDWLDGGEGVAEQVVIVDLLLALHARRTQLEGVGVGARLVLRIRLCRLGPVHEAARSERTPAEQLRRCGLVAAGESPAILWRRKGAMSWIIQSRLLLKLDHAVSVAFIFFSALGLDPRHLDSVSVLDHVLLSTLCTECFKVELELLLHLGKLRRTWRRRVGPQVLLRE